MRLPLAYEVRQPGGLEPMRRRFAEFEMGKAARGAAPRPFRIILKGCLISGRALNSR